MFIERNELWSLSLTHVWKKKEKRTIFELETKTKRKLITKSEEKECDSQTKIKRKEKKVIIEIDQGKIQHNKKETTNERKK